MAVEEVAAHLELGLVHMHAVTITAQQPVASTAPDEVAEVVAGDGGDAGHDHQVDEAEPVSGAREEGGSDQRGLAGHRHAEAFETDREENRPVAIRLDELRDGRGHEASIS